MKICGLQKTTLLDFPGRVAATIFTGGCNFRCPFCHNSGLLGSDAEEYECQEDILAFLEKRKRVLEGVCITGGEPTLQPDLEEFIRKVRSLGLAVKLDTNGYMDIKAGRNHYEEAAGVSGLSMERIDESIEFLLSGSIPYEFRTTVVRGIHTSDDFRQIGPWIKGCPEYYLQCFTESGEVLVPGIYSDFTKDEMMAFADLVRPYVGQVSLRGIDY